MASETPTGPYEFRRGKFYDTVAGPSLPKLNVLANNGEVWCNNLNRAYAAGLAEGRKCEAKPEPDVSKDACVDRRISKLEASVNALMLREAKPDPDAIADLTARVEKLENDAKVQSAWLVGCTITAPFDASGSYAPPTDWRRRALIAEANVDAARGWWVSSGDEELPTVMDRAEALAKARIEKELGCNNNATEGGGA